MRLSSLLVIRAALVAGAAAPLSALSAQSLNRTIDEGTFLISRSGVPAGRESFRISETQTAAGEAFRATAQVALGDQRIIPTLTCDSLGAPVTYDVTVQGGAEPGARLQARARPGRFTSMLRTRQGESTREYVVPKGVVVLDDDVVHQLYFVTMGGRRSGSLTLLAPRSGVQGIATLENRGTTAIEIGGRAIPALHFVLTGSGLPVREFWIDTAGRVLRAALPDRGIVAQRDEPPR
jgi:hypothetical protein